MHTQYLYLITTLLFPAAAFIIGRMGMKTPKKGSLIGYRTKFSMQNEITWYYANRYFGQYLWKAGWGMLCIAVVWMAMAIFYQLSASTIAAASTAVFCLQIFPFLWAITETETSLKKVFGQK